MKSNVSGKNKKKYIRRDSSVVEASTSQSVELGSIPLSSHTKRLLKMVFTAFLFDTQHKRNSVEIKALKCAWCVLG